MDVNGVYKPTYTLGGPSCIRFSHFGGIFQKVFDVPLMGSIYFQNVHDISIQLLGIIGVPTCMDTRMNIYIYAYIYIYWNMLFKPTFGRLYN